MTLAWVFQVRVFMVGTSQFGDSVLHDTEEHDVTGHVCFFLRNSVKYTQQTMEEALRRVKLMQANLGGTEILTPLQIIYRQPPVEGHPLQVGTERDKGNEKSLFKNPYP